MSTQPIERVAIIGASGRIGGAFARALLRTGKHTVTALTRASSSNSNNSTLPAGIKTIPVNYDDEASLIAALQGQQFLAITLGTSAPPDLHGRIAAAAGKARVPYVMPNIYGYPLPRNSNREDSFVQMQLARERDVTGNGFSAAVIMACGYWMEWSLAMGECWFGFEIAERKVTLFDDGERVITVSTWDQCGRALAGLLSLPESGASPSLADYKGKTALISSFRVSQREMLDSLHRVLGTTDADWEIRYEGTAKRIEDGIREFRAGDTKGFAKMIYGRVFAPDNEVSDYEGVDNDVLGLPKEDLDEVTKTVVEMVKSGWTHENPVHEVRVSV